MKTHEQRAASFGRSLALQVYSERITLSDAAVAAAIVAFTEAVCADSLRWRKLREEAAEEYKRSRDILATR